MKRYLLRSGTKVRLKEWSSDHPKAFNGKKDAGKKAHAILTKELCEMQELLFAQHTQKVMIVLQGMDTSGKDGTIRHVFEGLNQQGVRVATFKAPSEDELDHDYLWRVHREVPVKGQIVIFNRSHYEDVLVVRVRKLTSPKIWKRRFRQFNDFERMIAEEGTIILKFFLHIDQAEQKKRLEARANERQKNWKLNPQDLKDRKFWDQYMKAYEEALSKTSTTWAPWYIVPSNQKWFRNLVVSTAIVDTLKGLKLQYPESK